MDSARTGKIATLPAKIREEINRRLHDGQQARQILPWLNADKDVLRVLDEKWHEQPVSSSNLSEWRLGGYQDWLKRNERVDAIKTLSDYSLKVAQAAGGSITQGAAAIAGGRVMELLEAVVNPEGGDAPGFMDVNLDKLINALSVLRGREIDQKRTDQRDIVLQQRDRALALEEKRFQRQTAEMFIKFYEDRRAKEIAEGKGTKEVKMDKLVTLMFGEKPSTAGSSEGGEPG
jgi:hypothetical protein